MTAAPLVLASTSPQRRAILTQLRIPFEVVAPSFDEESVGDPLERAAGKARSVDGGDRAVLGVDTEVVLDGELLGKPADVREATRDAAFARRQVARGRLRSVPSHGGVGGAPHVVDAASRSAR